MPQHPDKPKENKPKVESIAKSFGGMLEGAVKSLLGREAKIQKEVDVSSGQVKRRNQ